jgi:hypothetical protein
MRYKDVFLGIVLFFLGIVYRKNLDKIAKVIFIGLILSLIYQAVMFLAPELFLKIANIFVYEKHLELVSGNLDRGRIYIETFDESIALILIWWLFKKYPARGNRYSIFLLMIVGYFSLISNFRTRILILAISLVGYLIFEYRRRAKKVAEKMRRTLLVLAFVFFALFISGMLAELFAVRTFGFSFVDRITFSDTQEDVETVFFRLNQLQNSWDLAGNNYSLGIGLGNYYESLPSSKNYWSFFSSGNDATIRGAAEYVHNIFGTFLAEGGFWAGILFSVIILKFISDDVRYFKKGKGEKDLLIFSFWGLFIYTFLNPFVPFVLQGLFWFLRGLIIADGKN